MLTIMVSILEALKEALEKSPSDNRLQVSRVEEACVLKSPAVSLFVMHI